MSRNGARFVLTAALVLGIIIFAIRGIKLDPAEAPPANPVPGRSFTLRMDASAWSCTAAGSIVTCTYKTPARTP